MKPYASAQKRSAYFLGRKRKPVFEFEKRFLKITVAHEAYYNR